MQLVTLPYVGLLATQGLKFAVPSADGLENYVFFLQVRDTRIRANAYTILRRIGGDDWQHFINSAFSSAGESYHVVPPQPYSGGWTEYALIPTNMGTFGRLIELGVVRF
jgi:hypothetical protein